MSGVSIETDARWGDEHLAASVRTDASGRFSAPGKRYFRFNEYIPLFGIPHYLYEWKVCFIAPEAGDVCYVGSEYTPGPAPEVIELDCDLARTDAVCTPVGDAAAAGGAPAAWNLTI